MGNQITWPQKYHALYANILRLSDVILTKTILSIDPSSGGTSKPGYAIFKAGKLMAAGEIDNIPSKAPIGTRLHRVYDEIYKLTPDAPDLLAIEMIRGKIAHEYLMFSVGASIAAGRALETIEVPTNVWKALAKVTPDYTKDNSWDAQMIGKCLIEFCKQKQFEKAAVAAMKGRKK